jgi:hypothetical protein
LVPALKNRRKGSNVAGDLNLKSTSPKDMALLESFKKTLKFI